MPFFRRKAVKIPLYILASAALFMFGALAGNTPREEPLPSQTAPAKPADAQLTERVTLTTLTQWRVEFTRCTHTVKTEGESLVGMSREEAERAFPLYKAKEFSSRRAIMVRTVEGCCPYHLFVRLDGDCAVVYRMDGQSFGFIETARIPAGNELNAEERTELNEGMIFSDMEEINSYFESVGS